MTVLINDDRLYALLPAVYRQRDVATGYPLRDLLRTLAAQAAIVEQDISQQYDDWFIETAADWVVPYIGDLVGWKPVHEGMATRGGNGHALALTYSSRSEIANTVAHRRRKGGLALLTQLASDVAGWPAFAIEFYRLLGWTQHLDHRHLDRGRTADVRDPRVGARIGGPFDRIARGVDVRRIGSGAAPGRYNIPSVGVFACRLQSFSVTRTPARQHEERGQQCFSFSVLGNDAPLFVRPRPADALSPGDPPELTLPVALDRALLQAPLARGRRARQKSASPAVYGGDRSLAIYAPNWPTPSAPQPVPAERVLVADLSDWRYRAPRGYVAVDSERGRLAFPQGQRPDHVWVSYAYGFPARLGGGEYARDLADPDAAHHYYVHAGHRHGSLPDGHFRSIHRALEQWGLDSRQPDGPRVGVIELVSSGSYAGPVRIDLAAGTVLHLRAANRMRPVIRLQDDQPDRSDAIKVRGGEGSRLVLDGLLVTGRGLEVRGPDRAETYEPRDDLCDVTIRHCTFVPGWALDDDCEPCQSSEPSIVLDQTSAALRIDHSIVGAIHVAANEFLTDPIAIQIADSVIDATGRQRVAIGSGGPGPAFAVLTIARTTVLGRVVVHAVDLAENTIFAAALDVARRQRGCVRYSFLPFESRSPRRHRCQPTIAVEEIDPALSGAERDAEVERVLLRVRPCFESERYGRPDYCRLAQGCASGLRGGADDESDMGVYHDLYEPQREASLRARLDECTPAGMQAGIVFVN